MALSALSNNLHETDSQEYSLSFPRTLREEFGFSFPSMTALPAQSSQSQEKIFTTGGESFMGQDPTVTIDQGVIVRMSPGVIRDIVRQFTDGPVDSVLPLTARGGIPFQILMIHDKTRQVFWMRNGKEPVRPLDKGSDADRNTIAKFFEYRSLLPPANLQIQFDSVSKAFPAKADLRNLFLRVRTTDDFTIPDGWTEDDWIKFVVRSRSGDPALKADVDDVQSFDTFLVKTFGATLFQEKDRVRGHAGPPNYEMAGQDLTEWIKFVLNVRSPDWNALYIRQIGMIFYVIDSRLVVFTVDKNTNRISCLSTSTDIIKYNIGNDNARSDDYSSLKVMLNSQMESLLDPRTLDKYSFDPGNRMMGDWQQSENGSSNTMPHFTRAMGCQLMDQTPNAAALGVLNFIAKKVKCTDKEVAYLKDKAIEALQNPLQNDLKGFIRTILEYNDPDFKLNTKIRAIVDAALESLPQPPAQASEVLQNLARTMQTSFETQQDSALRVFNSAPDDQKAVAKIDVNALKTLESATAPPLARAKLADVSPFDDNLARQTFDEFHQWLSSDNPTTKGELKEVSAMRYVALLFGADPQTALTTLLEFVRQALVEECKGGNNGNGKTLQEEVNTCEQRFNRAKDATPEKANAKKALDKARTQLNRNTNNLDSINRHISAAKDFAAAVPLDRTLHTQLAERALRNALLDLHPITHAADKGASTALLLHAFLMYFFDIAGVRSPDRDWDLVKPKDAEHVTRMLKVLLSIPM